MPRFCSVALCAALALATRAEDRPPDRAAGDGKPYTATYDVSHLLLRPGNRSGYRRIEEVVKAVVSAVDPGGWGGEQEGRSRLRELNGTRLEIRTTARHHKEIAELLKVLHRLHDLAVNLRAELLEIDGALWRKEIEPKLKGRPAAGFEDAVIDALRKKGERTAARDVPAAVGEDVLLLSVRQAFTFVESATLVEKKQVNEYGTGFTGVRIRVTPVVSADRRFVRLKITQRATELVEIEKRTKVVANTDEPNSVTVEVPETAETVTTTEATVEDGVWTLAAVPYRPASARGKDRVLVLVVRPAIYIEEEERERGGNNPK